MVFYRNDGHFASRSQPPAPLSLLLYGSKPAAKKHTSRETRSAAVTGAETESAPAKLSEQNMSLKRPPHLVFRLCERLSYRTLWRGKQRPEAKGAKKGHNAARESAKAGALWSAGIRSLGKRSPRI
eukprot:scaffold556_cov221-Pinguiococcus_pyrenoidosus.AAC.20